MKHQDSLIIDIFAITDKGNVREKNEDAYFVHENLLFACVCDGMGGHNGGQEASSMIVDVCHNYNLNATDNYSDSFPYSPNVAMTKEENNFVYLAHLANHLVFKRHLDEPNLRGMGSTLVALYICENNKDICFINVGDSRAYFINETMIRQITVDHSFEEEQRQNKRQQNTFFNASSMKHVITRAIGADKEVNVDFFKESLQTGYYLLCTDGLTGVLSDQEIKELIFLYAKEEQKIVNCLVKKVIEKKGNDNITIVLFSVKNLAKLKVN